MGSFVLVSFLFNLIYRYLSKETKKNIQDTGTSKWSLPLNWKDSSIFLSPHLFMVFITSILSYILLRSAEYDQMFDITRMYIFWAITIYLLCGLLMDNPDSGCHGVVFFSFWFLNQKECKAYEPFLCVCCSYSSQSPSTTCENSCQDGPSSGWLEYHLFFFTFWTCGLSICRPFQAALLLSFKKN